MMGAPGFGQSPMMGLMGAQGFPGQLSGVIPENQQFVQQQQ